MEIAALGFMTLPLLFFGLVVVLIVVIAVRGKRLAEQRRQELAGLARARGWGYTVRDDSWTTRFAAPPFGRGHDRQAHNIVTGRLNGRAFVSMDYVYSTTETSTDANGHTHSHEVSHPYGVVALDCGAAFPPLSVAPEGVLGRLWGRITDTDIELESEDFNRMFTVTCPSRRFASDLLHPEMMELLMREPDFAFQFDGPSIITVRVGRSPIPEIEARLAFLEAIVGRIPGFVWQTVRGTDA